MASRKNRLVTNLPPMICIVHQSRPRINKPARCPSVQPLPLRPPDPISGGCNWISVHEKSGMRFVALVCNFGDHSCSRWPSRTGHQKYWEYFGVRATDRQQNPCQRAHESTPELLSTIFMLLDLARKRKTTAQRRGSRTRGKQRRGWECVQGMVNHTLTSRTIPIPHPPPESSAHTQRNTSDDMLEACPEFAPPPPTTLATSGIPTTAICDNSVETI
uniref:Uncharacterized protein n=1 Tax=Physcomitrium patens TaxID=3218 RepID=A0A2K1KM25_PHYPA|nr:hypothetical protein PHYPA_005725 [Physcomitrium patens]